MSNILFLSTYCRAGIDHLWNSFNYSMLKYEEETIWNSGKSHLLLTESQHFHMIYAEKSGKWSLGLMRLITSLKKPISFPFVIKPAFIQLASVWWHSVRSRQQICLIFLLESEGKWRANKVYHEIRWDLICTYPTLLFPPREGKYVF